MGGPDVSIQMGTSTPLLFPSIPKTINQATLVDFMSMWTLLQRRMELPSVPDNSISPTVQASLPVPERDSEHCQLHGRITVRWLYLTSWQRLFGGLLEFSRTRTCATWPVLLRACRHWVQWWSHNTSWIQDIFTHLHSLHDRYAATATTFLMKNT